MPRTVRRGRPAEHAGRPQAQRTIALALILSLFCPHASVGQAQPQPGAPTAAQSSLQEALRFQRSGDQASAARHARALLESLRTPLADPELGSAEIWAMAGRAAIITQDDELGALALEAMQRLSSGAAADAEALAVLTDLRARGLEGRLEQVRKDRAVFLDAWRSAHAPAAGEPALIDVAAAYQQGRGVPRSAPESRSWYAKAAEAGSAVAMRRLGMLAASSRNDTEARAWFLKAAEHGDGASMHNMGVLCLQGRGGPADARAARGWFGKAALLGDEDAILALASMLAGSSETPADQPEAVKWYRRLAQKGNVTALHNLGVLHLNGGQAVRDPEEAARCFRKGADKEDPDSLFALGALYMRGEGVGKDLDRAVSLWRRAVRLGHARAQESLRKAGAA